MKKKIELRNHIDDSIFEEMENLYPSATRRKGMTTKQSVDHIALPADFDFEEFQRIAGPKASELFFALNVVLAAIAKDMGFWTLRKCLSSVSSENIDNLIKWGYLANLKNDTVISSKYSIREYELCQSARKANRTRTREKKPVPVIANPDRKDFELDFSDFSELTSSGDDLFEE